MSEEVYKRPEVPYYYEIQYSPMALEIIGGVERLRDLAAEVAAQWPEDCYYPESWFLKKAKEKSPEVVKITMIEIRGVIIKIVPMMDDKGIRVLHFDPSRELHGIKAGQHRMKHNGG